MELMSSRDQSFDSIVFSLRETVGSVFQDDVLVKLAYLEQCGESNVALARLQIVNWG